MFRRPKNILGIDIGECSVKAVQLIASDGKPRIAKVGERTLPEGTYTDRENKELIKQACANTLSTLMREMGVAPDQVRGLYATVPGDKVNLKQIKSLPLSDEELQSSLAFEARKHVPIDGEWLMDFQVLERGAEELQVLLAVASKEAVRDHLEIFTRCGFANPVLDAPALAVVNGFALNPALEQEAGTVLHLHVGASATLVCLRRKSGLFFVRSLPVAGNRFTEELAQRFKISLPEAEKLKTEKGIEADRQSGAGESGTGKIELASATDAGQTALEELLREIQRSVRFYAKETGNGQLDLAVFSGGSVRDRSLVKAITGSFRCPVTVPDPFAGLFAPAGIAGNNATQYLQALGLALRGMHDVFPDQLK